MSSTRSVPLGYEAAKRVVELGRAAFLGSHEADLPKERSALVAKDDLLPQFGYIGQQYARTRLLLLGINPGNGPDGARTPRDEIMMPALHRFVTDSSQQSFVEAQRAYQQVCSSWPVWRRHCSEVIGAGLLTLNDVAYSNCLPWRTASESPFDDIVASNAAKLYAYPLIDELQPQIIVAMGKKAGKILLLGGRTFANLLTWNRAQAATPLVLQERVATAAKIFRILGRSLS